MSDTGNITKITTEIQQLRVIIYKSRCSRLVSRVSIVTEILTSSQKTHPPQVLTLLKVTLEDICNFMKQLLSKSKALAISILKFGTHEENFAKLNEQLQHCAILLGVPMAKSLDAQDIADFNEDLKNLKQELQSILAELVRGKRQSQAQFFDQYLVSTTQLVENQLRIRSSYRSKRHPTDDLSISGADLEFIKTVGRGGFATVWLGRYKKEQEVAIKVLNIEASDSTVEDFKNEAEIMRRMVHRNITSCYGIAETDKGYCMVMEYLANDSLFSYMKANRNNPPSWSQKIDFALDIARGVAFLHRLGIIHRDLKLSNILLDSNLRSKIADFGLSHIKTSQTSIIHLQEAGTVPYMAPETFGANASYSTRSDIYAFGMMLWGISHWEQPFKGMVREEIRELVWKERYRPKIDSNVPKAVESLVILAWTQNAANRPPMKEIESFISGLVFIEGLEDENDLMDTDMSTVLIAPVPKALPKTAKFGASPVLSKDQGDNATEKIGLSHITSSILATNYHTKQSQNPRSIDPKSNKVENNMSTEKNSIIELKAMVKSAALVEKTPPKPLMPRLSSKMIVLLGVFLVVVIAIIVAVVVVLVKQSSAQKTNLPLSCKTYNNPVVSTLPGSGFIHYRPGAIGLSTSPFPKGIAITPDGNLIISQELQPQLLFYNISSQALSPLYLQQGIYTDDIGPLQVFSKSIHQIAVSSDGSIYAPSDSAIFKITNGAVTVVAGDYFNPPTAPFSPNTLGSSGSNLLMNGSNVVVFDFSDSILRLSSDNSLSTFVSPISATYGGLDSKGNLIVAVNNDLLKKVTPDGKVLPFLSSPRFGTLGGLIIDNCDNIILIEDSVFGRVSLIKPDLNVTLLAGSSGFDGYYKNGNGTIARFNGIYNLVQDEDGSIYIPDHGNNVIRKISFS